MARKTKEEAMQTRRQIMEAAMSLFGRQGLIGTSLVDIAREAGVTRGAIYWHFANKEELFIALMGEMCEPMQDLVTACTDPAEVDPLGLIKVTIRHLLHSVRERPAHRQLFRVLFNLMGQVPSDDSVWAMLLRQLQGYREHLALSLANAVSRRQLPANLDCERAAVFLQCALDGFILNWLNDIDGSMQDDVDMVLDGLFVALSQGGFVKRAAEAAAAADCQAVIAPKQG